MKLRYKIISCSSEDPPCPFSNLITNSGCWESARFCQYPQQITIKFYEPITIESIIIVSHPCKIASRVNVLFCLPEYKQLDMMYRFQKYGYFEFGSNAESEYKLREVKKIEGVNVNAQYMRLIFWKNHQNSFNFFNQIGLSQITVHGSPYSHNLLLPSIDNKSFLNNLTSTEYLEAKLQILEQFKQEFSKSDDFESAKQVKEIIKAIKKEGEKIKDLEERKQEAVLKQEYEQAKLIKKSIEELKKDIQYMANNFYDPAKKTIRPVMKESKFKNKIEEIMSSTSMKSHSLQGSRVSAKLKKAELQILGEEKESVSDQEEENEDEEQEEEEKEEDEDEDNDQNFSRKSRISYENQIVPAVLHKNKKDFKTLLKSSDNLEDAAYEDNEFIEKYTKQEDENIEPEDMTPSAEANASVLFEIYEKQIVKKLHSKHWNFKNEAINHIYEENNQAFKSGGHQNLQKNRAKSILFVFNKCLKEGSLPIVSLTLDLMNLFLQATKSTDAHKLQELRLELNADLDKSVNELFLKMSDSQKTKEKADQVLKNMMDSKLYGETVLYHSIVRSYFNPTLTHNNKIKKYKLKGLEDLVQKFGVGGNGNGLPIHSIDFVAKAAEDQSEEIRKQATSILKAMKQKGQKEKVIEVVRSKQTLKPSIVKQLQS